MMNTNENGRRNNTGAGKRAPEHYGRGKRAQGAGGGVALDPSTPESTNTPER